jgi:hypothetical protein
MHTFPSLISIFPANPFLTLILKGPLSFSSLPL